jgi:hypothetical protein
VKTNLASVLDKQDRVNLQGKLPLYTLMRCKPAAADRGQGLRRSCVLPQQAFGNRYTGERDFGLTRPPF